MLFFVETFCGVKLARVGVVRGSVCWFVVVGVWSIGGVVFG